MNNRIQNCIQILKYAIKHNISAPSACKKNLKGDNYLSDFLRIVETRKKLGQITQEEYTEFKSLHNEYLAKQTPKLPKSIIEKNKKNNFTKLKLDTEPLTQKELDDLAYNAELDDSYDERSHGKEVKDENNKIIHYVYKVLIRDQPPLEGTFSRDEMDRIYRLYSNMDGAGLTLRAVSREFTNLTYRDFKRILRAFNITKQSTPFAPHILEENDPETISEYMNRNKENAVLKKYEENRGKFLEKNLLDTRKKLFDLEQNREYVKNIVEKYVEKKDENINLIKKVNAVKKSSNTKTSTICIFGDIHFGKKFNHPVYGRGYNKEIAHERVMQIAQSVIDDCNFRQSAEIHLICVGDLIESIMPDGMRQEHTYELDLFKEEQIFYAVDSLKEMIQTISNSIEIPLHFHIIGGNHDRIGIDRDDDKGRTAAKIISNILKRELESSKIKFNIPDNNLLRIISDKLCIFIQHGDSSLSKKNPSELVNLFGEPGCYTLLLQGHWHSLKIEEGTNFIAMKIPSVTSTDSFIMETLGNNNLPGFIIGNQPDNCYGFNYTKKTLY